eukprot:16203706-Heterocapsa_arctica.AAC.1
MLAGPPCPRSLRSCARSLSSLFWLPDAGAGGPGGALRSWPARSCAGPWSSWVLPGPSSLELCA